MPFSFRSLFCTHKNTFFFAVFFLGAVALTLGLMATGHADAASPALVQATSTGQYGAAVSTSTFASNTTAGNMIMAVVTEWGDSSYPTGTISDTQGNTFYLASSTHCSCSGDYADNYLYYAPRIKGGPDTVSFAWNTVGGNISMGIAEYSGMAFTDPLDQVNQAAGVSFTSVNTGNVTTTIPDELLFSFTPSPPTASTTISSGWSVASSLPYNGESNLIMADRVANATGTYSNTFGGATTTYYGMTAMIASFFPETHSPPGILSFGADPAFIGTGRTSTLSWNVLSAATATITISPGSFSTTTLAGSLTVAPTSTTVYTLTATNTNGSVTATGTVAIDTTPPSIPTNLAATVRGDAALSLTWASSTDAISGVAGYKIFRCQGPSCTPTMQVGTSSTPFYEDINLSASTTYTYAVAAYNGSGVVSAASQTVSATTRSAYVISFVQSTSSYIDGSAGNLTFSYPVSAGDTIIIGISGANAGCYGFGVTDSLGNTYYAAATSSAVGDFGIYWARAMTSGTDTVYYNDMCGGGQVDFSLLEYSGLAPLPFDVATTSSTNPTTGSQGTGDIITTQANDLLFSMGFDYSSGPVSSEWTVSPGWTKREAPTGGGASTAALTADDIVSATGTYANTFGNLVSGDAIGTAIAAFKAATPPVISSFVATPSSLLPGATSTLSWTVSNASSVAILPGGFSTTTLAGSLTMHPTSTTAYILTATNPSGSLTAAADATVYTTSTAPQNLGAISGDGQVSLSWSAPSSTGGSAIDAYVVYDRSTGSGNFSQVATTSPSETTFTVSSLTNGASYEFEVAAKNGVGLSSASTIIASTPIAPSHTSGNVVSVAAGYVSSFAPPPESTSSAAPSSSASSASSSASTSAIPTTPAGIAQLLVTLQAQLQSLLNRASAEGIDISSISPSSPLSSSAPISTPAAFTTNLHVGMQDPEVKVLQHYLNLHGFPVNTVPGHAGSLGYETDYFGLETRAALTAFQKAHGITPPEGYFGPITRAFIAAH